MNDLTEQWKKGELKQGWYYVKVIPDFEYSDDIAFYTGGYFELYSDDDIEQVLSPMPSYDEWKIKLEENTKLKELLKECRKWVGVERNFAVPNEKVILQQLLTEIDEELKQDD